MQNNELYLFGGDQPWDSSLWVTTDDRVRGGSSISHLQVINPKHARFYGHLDTSTLGGAGFASQHGRDSVKPWDLSAYAGLVVSVIGVGDPEKRFVLTLKDDLPGKRHDGREKSGLSWEAELVASESGDVQLAWEDFKPTYRGRRKEDAKPLDLTSIKQVGLMMRSFFDKQDGDFSIDLCAISARKSLAGQTAVGEESGRRSSLTDADDDLRKAPVPQHKTSRRTGWRKVLCCGNI